MKIAFKIGMLFEYDAYYPEPENFWDLWNILEAQLPGLKSKEMYGII